ISPVYPYGTEDVLFDVEDLDEKEYIIQVVTDREIVTTPEISLNGFIVEGGDSLDYDDFAVWEYAVADHLFYDEDNTFQISLEEEGTILSAHLLVSSRDILPLEEESLSDGRRYSGRSPSYSSLLVELLEGQAEMEEIILYFKEEAPRYFFIENEGTGTYLSPETEETFKEIYSGQAFLDTIGVDFPYDLQEIAIQGSRKEIVTPYVEMIFPVENITLPQYATYNYKVLGITDCPDGEISVNGVTAEVSDHFFWVEMSRLGISEADSYYIEATVVHSNGEESADGVWLTIESDSNALSLDQDDSLHVTTDSTFEISGSITGYEKDLEIDGVPVSVPDSRVFSYDVPLEMGLNTIHVDLLSEEGSRVLVSEMRQVYRQDIEPSLTITSPDEGSMTNGDTISVSGTVSPWGLESVYVNGFEAVVSGENYSCSDLPLADEVNLITVQATYETGSTVEESVWVTKDQIAPVISDVSPAEGSFFGIPWTVVSGTVVEENDVTVYVNGLLATVTGDSFSVVVPFSDGGDQTIRISAQDEAGNSTDWPEFSLFYDSYGPEAFEVEIDPEDWTNNTRPTISFETEDAHIGLSHYEVSVNGGSFYDQESPYQLPNLPDGAIPIVVRAYDLFDNYTDSTVYAYIDTVAPEGPDNFRVVPGNERVLLRWEEDSEDRDEGDSYVMGIVGSDEEYSLSEPYEETDGTAYFEQAIEGLVTGDTYQFYIMPVDSVGNIGSVQYDTVTTSETAVEIETNGMSVLEYDNVTMYFPQGALDEVVDQIVMEEVEDEYILEQTTNPVVSPIYSFSVADDAGNLEDHYTFEEPYVGVISFENFEEVEADELIHEHKLAVYYYDDTWGKWFITEENLVNTEDNTITFATDHFTEFTVQATSTETIDYRQWKNMEYPLTGESASHSSIEVSPQGGSASTAMTEFSLPGKNGMDLVIRRLYSSTYSDSDSTLTPINSLCLYSADYLDYNEDTEIDEET
ncbi:MAG: hypothetical protein PQJ60_07630, partial [Spirochaetales bacterium]|nr:hypothetical protein [Spirochaetales bacterium]